MNPAAKTAKYFAYGLAGVIIFGIIAGIVAAIGGILMAVGIIGGKAPDVNVDCAEYEKCLALSIGAATLEIKEGNELAYTSDIDNLEVSLGDTKLVIKDKSRVHWFGNNDKKTITVTVPKDMKFDMIGIASGAGKINTEKLVTKGAKFDLGAGETMIRDLEVSDSAKIDAGVGKVTIDGGLINNAEIALGIGSANISSKLTGKSKIDCGIGSVNLNLLLPDSAYTIRADKGIGSINFNGSKISDSSIIGNGDYEIDIDGGIGSINITTAAKNDVEKLEENTVEESKEDVSKDVNTETKADETPGVVIAPQE